MRALKQRSYLQLFAGFIAVGVLGFVTDAGLLAAGLAAGLSPVVARAIPVSVALQVTFLLNGVLVFRRLNRGLFVRQWMTYMAANVFGAGCNYVIFIALLASPLPLVSDRAPAFIVAAVAALAVNYTGTRFLAFGRAEAPK
jgi:putative flippase GtrA